MDDRIPHGQSMHPAEARDADVRHASSHAHAGAGNARALAAHARMVASLRASFESGGLPVTILETHISTVIVAGSDAYKIKKPVALPFLDFSSPALRRRFCRAEIRLNRRFAPDIYLGMVPITGTPAHPALAGPGPPIDYAVHMRAFPQEALAASMLERGRLTPLHMDRLAAAVAAFHAAARRAHRASRHGAPAGVLARALANCTAMQGPDLPLRAVEAVARLRVWTAAAHARLHATFAARHAGGFVRDVHGDLHLGNVVVRDGVPTPFDCIEFSPDLRWNDVMSEVAFLVMDLEDRGRADLATRFLNEYLEHTGDYEGVAVLPFYLVYRAMVRAKVACLRLRQQASADERAVAEREMLDHLRLAESFTVAHRPALVITHGASASGKSTFAAGLAVRTRAIRIRTDVERKRIAALPRTADSASSLDDGLYAPAMTRAAYLRVATLARATLAAGMVTVVDATFLARWQRQLLRDVAEELGVPFAIASLQAPADVLHGRLAARRAAGEAVSEADAAVLDHQLATMEPFAADERAAVVAIDSMAQDAASAAASTPVMERLALAGVAPFLTDAGDFAARVAFLRRPAVYPVPGGAVTTVETHLSWLFLTEREAWKLKKPVRTEYVDLTTLESRRANAEDELRLNRRLAPDVYLAVVPLRRRGDGMLSLGPDGVIVDWLVRMRRLPRDAMLDAHLRAGDVPDGALDALISLLCRFYSDAPRALFTPAAYQARFVRAIALHAQELAGAAYGLPASLVARVHDAQLARLGALAPALRQRAGAHHVVEAHGDLRPEHVCLASPPAVIDCLEFSRELRVLDPAEEIAFLALECERLEAERTPHASAVAAALVARYRERARDSVPDALVQFYMSHRATVRARLAARHLTDPALPEDHWRASAIAYLELALRHALA